VGEVEEAIDRRLGDPELLGQGGDAGAVCVLLDEVLDLVVVELGGPAANAPTDSSGGGAVIGVRGDELRVEVGEGGEHAEEVAAVEALAVDLLLDHVEADAAVAEVGAQDDEVLDGV